MKFKIIEVTLTGNGAAPTGGGVRSGIDKNYGGLVGRASRRSINRKRRPRRAPVRRVKPLWRRLPDGSCRYDKK